MVEVLNVRSQKLCSICQEEIGELRGQSSLCSECRETSVSDRRCAKDRVLLRKHPRCGLCGILLGDKHIYQVVSWRGMIVDEECKKSRTKYPRRKYD